ncbi:hypothetical protein BH10ACT7_BH10ACT7_01080 [soil metagenome]
MTWVYPVREAVETTRLGIARAFYWVAGALLAGASLVVIVTVAVGASRSPVVAFAALGALVLCVLVVRFAPRLSPPTLVALLLVGIAGCTGVAWSMFPAGAIAAGASTYPLIAASISITLTGGAADRWTGYIGTIIGYVASQAGIYLGLGLAGEIAPFGGASLVAAIVVAMFHALLSRARSSARAATEGLERAAMSSVADAERAALEIRSRALLHDTVLGELVALGLMKPGPLGERALASIRASLALVGDMPPPRANDDAPAALGDLLERMRQNGLAVLVEGDTASVALAVPEVRDGLFAALEQCLVNVVRHAGVGRAEVSFVHNGDWLTVTVVDDGVGFDEATVADDRFGLRESVTGRIAALGGSTRVLSSPGNGTVVVLTVPLAHA